jgi:hypothetical protein
MAIVKVKDAKVVSVNQSGFGIKILESNEYQGKTYSQRYTVWFKEPHGLNVGDIVSVSGFLGVKGATWEDKTTGETKIGADVSINSPRIENAISAPVSERKVVPSVPAKTWDEDAPF